MTIASWRIDGNASGHPVRAERIDENVDEEVDDGRREDQPLETLKIAAKARQQIGTLPDDDIEKDVAGEQKQREPELPLDEAIDCEAADGERRGQRRDAHNQVIGIVDQAIPFWNSAMSFGPILTGTRFLFGPPTASRSGLTPRAPAEATVCDCCACEPPPGFSLLNMPPLFFGSSFFSASAVFVSAGFFSSPPASPREPSATVASSLAGLTSKVMFFA